MSDTTAMRIADVEIPYVGEIDLTGFDECESSLNFDDPQVVLDMLMEHFAAGEHDAFSEILALYMKHVGKNTIVRETKIPAIYSFIEQRRQMSAENICKMMRFLSGQTEKATV